MRGSGAWGRDVSPTVSPQDGDVILGRDGAVACDTEWDKETTFSGHELEAHASRGRVHEPQHAHMHGRDDVMASEEHQNFSAATARGRDLGPGLASPGPRSRRMQIVSSGGGGARDVDVTSRLVDGSFHRPQWSLNASSAREHTLQTTHSTCINTSSSSSSTLHLLLAKSALLLQGV